MSGVTSDLRDGIRTIEFFHERGNSLPASSLRALADAFHQAGSDPSTRAVVLRSRGEGAFCGGASFDELLAVKSESQGEEFFMGFARLILAMRSCPKFIVTRVQGKVVGGGVGVVAASDYAVAHASASLRLSELALGIGPFVVGPVIERKIGPGAFSQMAIDTEWRTASWAKERGLYAEVYDRVEDLETIVGEMALKFSRMSHAATSTLKTALYEGTDHWTTLLETRAAISGRLVLTPEARAIIEGLSKR